MLPLEALETLEEDWTLAVCRRPPAAHPRGLQGIPPLQVTEATDSEGWQYAEAFPTDGTVYQSAEVHYETLQPCVWRHNYVARGFSRGVFGGIGLETLRLATLPRTAALRPPPPPHPLRRRCIFNRTAPARHRSALSEVSHGAC
jgi:hypothetical protein